MLASKSYLIALALVEGHLTVDEAAHAAHVEVQSQIDRWGEVEDSAPSSFFTLLSYSSLAYELVSLCSQLTTSTTTTCGCGSGRRRCWSRTRRSLHRVVARLACHVPLLQMQSCAGESESQVSRSSRSRLSRTRAGSTSAHAAHGDPISLLEPAPRSSTVLPATAPHQARSLALLDATSPPLVLPPPLARLDPPRLEHAPEAASTTSASSTDDHTPPPPALVPHNPAPSAYIVACTQASTTAMFGETYSESPRLPSVRPCSLQLSLLSAR